VAPPTKTVVAEQPRRTLCVRQAAAVAQTPADKRVSLFIKEAAPAPRTKAARTAATAAAVATRSSSRGATIKKRFDFGSTSLATPAQDPPADRAAPAATTASDDVAAAATLCTVAAPGSAAEASQVRHATCLTRRDSALC